MGADQNQKSQEVVKRIKHEKIIEPPTHRTAAANLERAKIDRMPTTNEQKQTVRTFAAPSREPEIHSREQVIKTIDNTPANKVPDFTKPAPTVPEEPEFRVKKSNLDQYHTAWQKYYQDYYANYYSDAVKSEKIRLKRQKIGGKMSVMVSKIDDLSEKEQARKLHHEIAYKAKKTAKKVRRSRHFIPIIAAAVVVLAILTIQFNQMVTGYVEAFISPSGGTDQPLLIATIEDMPVGEDNMLVIPKLGLESPLVFDARSNQETDMQEALERGVVWYNLPKANSMPGQLGNAVFLGHSSGDIFYGGQFKYIFSKLNRLNVGDTFYLNFNKKRYIYSIERREVIWPNEFDKLYMGDGNAWVTLITCDPPGSSVRRLAIYGKQISPDPHESSSAEQPSSENNGSPQNITGRTPTLFERIFGG
ncbi:sortase [Candidatus Saccharibacteria bacterium]|nr:sortase [Candidatus Saccharibacteria bacterium]